jgi:3-deoxy-D-manno-octulosonate 8-phosphate phosphatase (KDO 8-P phosphatase)
MVGRKSSPLFMNYIREKDLVDYISYQRGDLNAVRELCELVMGLTDTFEDTIQQRVSASEEFQAFLEERDEIESKFYHKVDRKIIETVI